MAWQMPIIMGGRMKRWYPTALTLLVGKNSADCDVMS